MWGAVEATAASFYSRKYANKPLALPLYLLYIHVILSYFTLYKSMVKIQFVFPSKISKQHCIFG